MSLVNKPAPRISAPALHEGQIKPWSLQHELDLGRWVVLFFYPKDFTFVCPTELVGFAEHHDAFVALGAAVVGASTDTAECHRGWLAADPSLAGLPYALLGDHKKEVARAYDVLDEEAGVALRGTFIIDPSGRLRWAQVNDLDTGREVGEVIRVLRALQTGGLTACGWRPGQSTLTPA